MFKTPKSEIEIEMEKLLKEAEDIVDYSHLTTQDARKVLNYCYKLLSKVEEIRKSRDKWRNKFTQNIELRRNQNETTM